MTNPADSLIAHFSQVSDPRIERGKEHLLIDILIIAICGAICGADDWVAIADFGRAKQDWLKTFLKLPNGIPSHDTFGRVFARISPWQFQDRFSAWIASIVPKFEDEIVPIDGKTVRRSYDRSSGKSALHMVNAWAVKNRLVLGQFHCEGGLDEIRIIPELLRVLDLKGCIATVDAIGCHKSVAEQVIKQEGDYVLAVKENQPKLLRHIQQVFNRTDRQLWGDLSVDYYQTFDENHGRIEIRRYWVTDQIDGFENKEAWKGLRLFGMVEAERRVKDQVSIERRYYISSLNLDAKRFGQAVRGHWGIENSLHWVLDVVFREDQSRVRIGHAPENLAVVRQIAVSLLQQEKTAKVGVKNKRLRAAWDTNYLTKVLSLCHF